MVLKTSVILGSVGSRNVYDYLSQNYIIVLLNYKGNIFYTMQISNFSSIFYLAYFQIMYFYITTNCIPSYVLI